LDDFYSLQLDKLDRYVCLKESGVVIVEGDAESSSDGEDDDDDGDDDEGDDDEGDDDDDDEVDHYVTMDQAGLDSVTDAAETKDVKKKAEVISSYVFTSCPLTETAQVLAGTIHSRATTFMGVAKDTERSAEDIASTPLPGETLAMFYARSRSCSHSHFCDSR
jgi:hypothetical protein